MAYWGITVDEITLRHCCHTDKLGTTTKATVECARHYGLQATEISNATWTELLGWLAEGIYPIVFVNLFPIDALWSYHAVVVEEVVYETVTLLDPLVGRRQVVTAAFEQAWQLHKRRVVVIVGKSEEHP